MPGCVLTASDRLDILELLARADSAATRRDVEGYVGLFTDDAVLDGEKGEQRGKDASRLTVGRVWQAEGTDTVHLTRRDGPERFQSGSRGGNVDAADSEGRVDGLDPQRVDHHSACRESAGKMADRASHYRQELIDSANLLETR